MIDGRVQRIRGLGPRRLSVAGRLALVFCGLAVFSTALTLLLQDRTLDRDLERAARSRLDRSARAADELLREHLSSVAKRYSAISRTPELRANLDIGHSETLVFFAEQLRKDHGSALVAFQDPDSRTVAWSGVRTLARALPGAFAELGRSGSAACLEIDDPGRRGAASRGAGAYQTCRYPSGRIEVTPIVVEGSAYAAVVIPLHTGIRRVGSLLVAEAIGEELLETWSRLCGAGVQIGREAPQGNADLIETATRFPTGGLWISSSLETESVALRRSRRNLFAAGLLALATAFAASLALSRSLSRPLRALQEATERIRRGDLSIRLRSNRSDELGDLSHAFDSMLDRLDESQNRLRRVQQLARFGEWSLRVDAGVVEGSPEFHRALGIIGSASTELRLTEMLERIHPEDRTTLRREIERCREVDGTFELQIRSPRGAESRVLLFQGRSRTGEGGPPRLEGSLQDLTEQKRVEEQIRYLSYHNPVTGLGNRRFFRERLLQSCRRRERSRFAVVLLGLDNFQILNETHGHSFGDTVLRGTASRLLDAFSSENPSLGSNPAIGHLGGDEFALLFDGMASTDEASAAAEMVLDRVSQPHGIQGEELVVTASIGICFGTASAVSPEALLRNCDSALHQAKDAGRNHIEFFDESVRVETSRRLRLETHLRRAVEEARLELHYQPRIAADTQTIVCFEALLRWTHDELGAVSPVEFIPVAEQSGLIQSIGTWAMVRALEDLRRWSEAGYDQARVSINLSPHQFHGDIDSEIQELLQGLDPQRIELEVTENDLLRDEEAAIDALRRLRHAGFRISLDDFGTGYSSLSYLRKLPLDTVKIDRSFISSMDRDPAAAALIGSIIAMVRTLRLGVVAEGVETEEQCEMLIEMGCDELQGFFFSPAVPGDAALSLLAPRRDKKKSRVRADRRPRPRARKRRRG